MKKLFVIAFLFSFGFSSISQTKDYFTNHSKAFTYKVPKQNFNYSNWSLGFVVTSSVENINPNLIFSEAVEFYVEPKFSYEIEVFVEKRLPDQLFWMAGINYHKLSFDYDQKRSVYFSNSNALATDETIINEYQLDFNNAFEDITLLAVSTFWNFEDGNDYEEGDALQFRIRSVNSARYIGIPLALKKLYGKGKLKLSTTLGIEPAFLIHSKTDYSAYRQSGFSLKGDREDMIDMGKRYPRVSLETVEILEKSSNLMRPQANVFIGFGFEHTNRFHTLFMESGFKRGFMPFSEKKNEQNYLQSIRIKVGIIRRFEERKTIGLVIN